MNQRLPTFIIGGAPRSGTTFLCHVLDKHPDVYLAKPYIPEPKICLTACIDGIQGYKDRYSDLFKNAGDKKILGEKTSYYLENEQAFERLTTIFNKIRFLFIVREPVERAYSNYLFSVKNGLETLSFEEAIASENKRIDPFPAEMSYVRPFNYMTRGDYATYAERFISIFGREQVKFVLYEDIGLSAERFYKEIQEFIQVEPLPKNYFKVGIINATDSKTFPMDSILKNQLREKIRPSVERFANLTGLDVSPWGY